MLTRRNPKSVHAPALPYSHATDVPPGARWLFVSGQVDQAFRNVLAVLADGGMGPEDTGTYREVRARHLRDLEPASTLVIVAALASPDWLVEVEAVAAKA